MRFAEPNFLWCLFSLPLFALLFYYAYHRRKKLAARFVSLSMLPKLSTSVSPWRRLAKVTILLLAIAFLFVALARPQWGRKMEHVERRGLDLVLLQDISLSMLAEDVKPNRLVRSRHEISAFLEGLSGDRVGLVAFSGEAQVMVPLTLDYGTVQMMLRELNPGWLMPGTNLENAIRKGMTLFKNSGGAGQYSVMILMSDGEELEAAAVNAAKEAAEMGIKIYSDDASRGRNAAGDCERDGRPVFLREPGRIPVAEGIDRDCGHGEEGTGFRPHGKLPGPLPDIPRAFGPALPGRGPGF